MTASETDWHTISDPSKRRKIQNRVNQRISRQRRAQRSDSGGTLVIREWKPKSNVGSTPFYPSSQRIPSVVDSTERESSAVGSYGLRHTTAHKRDEDGETLFHQHGDHHTYCSRRWNLTLADSRLLTLIYYNVFRGLHWNIDILGLDIRQMCRDDYPSPFTAMSPSATSAITKLPPTLCPTALQQEVAHHPCWDIFPCPVIRDNVLKRSIVVEDEELCEDVMGMTEDGRGFLGFDEGPRTGCTLWGDPWDIRTWEVSEYIAMKWGWLFEGAFELQATTNARRRGRGWKEIQFV